MPIGRPEREEAQGTASPGHPEMLAKAVNIACRRGPTGLPSISSGWLRAAGQGKAAAAGVTITS